MKFLKSLLAIILVIAMVVPCMNVVAAIATDNITEDVYRADMFMSNSSKELIDWLCNDDAFVYSQESDSFATDLVYITNIFSWKSKYKEALKEILVSFMEIKGINIEDIRNDERSIFYYDFINGINDMVQLSGKYDSLRVEMTSKKLEDLFYKSTVGKYEVFHNEFINMFPKEKREEAKKMIDDYINSSEYSKKIQNIVGASGIITDIVNIAKNSVDTFLELKTYNRYDKQFIDFCYYLSRNSESDYIKEVSKELYEDLSKTFEESQIRIIVDISKQLLNNVTTTAIEKSISKIATSLGWSSLLSAAKIGIDAGNSVSDQWFSTKETNDIRISMRACADLTVDLKKCVSSQMNSYKTKYTSKSSRDNAAKKLIYYTNLLYQTRIWGETLVSKLKETSYHSDIITAIHTLGIYDFNKNIDIINQWVTALNKKFAIVENQLFRKIYPSEYITVSFKTGNTTSNNTVGSMTSSSSKSTYTTDENVVITWTQATNATRYGLTIVNNATNEKVVNASNFTGTSYTVGKLPAGTYRFNMCGYNSNGNAGPVSALKEFTVKSNSDNASSGSNYSTGTYKCTSSNGLNMRSGPSTSNSAIQGVGVYYNSTFVVTKVSGNWGYTTFNGASGWVCLDYATYIGSSTTSPSVGNTDKNATGFVKYVNGRVGESFPANSCQAFVWEVVYKHFGKNADACCATNAWNQWKQSTSKNDIPLGATVYFGNSGVIDICNKDAGHSAIYVGNNTIVHAWSGKIVSTTIDWVTNRGYSYRGWGWQANLKITQSTTDKEPEQEKTPETDTPEYETIPEGTYVLNCIVKTYRYLTAKTDSNGGQVEAKPFENIDAQKFEIVKSGNGYKIVSKNSSSGRVVSGYNDGAGQTIGNVTLANPSNSSSQVWLFRKEGDCYVIYPSFNTSLALTSASTGRVVVSTYTGNDDQLWKLSLQNEEPEEYTVTYNANGGTDVPDKQIKTEGDSIRIASEEPTRNGYEFLGWSTSKNGDVEFESGDKYTDDKNITLYAVWEEIKTYTIKYNANGGSGAPSSQTKTHGESIKVSSQKPTRSGYEFDGWATSANGDVEYSPSEHYTQDGDITLYAIWKVNTYTIRYNANGGIGAPKNQTKSHAENIVLSSQEPTREDYIFLGWSTSAQGSVEFAPGSVCSVNENITLYALWQEAENEVYYIIYNANGGKNAPSMQTKNEDEDISISEVVPTREGYTFDGWAIGDDDTVVYSSGDTYKENKTLYLHAVWTANTYTISYDANGGFGAPRNQSKIHDENITLSAVVPEKEDCMFIGWSDNPDAEYAEYYAEDIFAENSDTVLYAVWEEIVEEDEQNKQDKLPFEDIPEDAWYRKDVENAYKNGLINGKSEKRYAPNDNMTYAEAIKLACTIYQLYYDGEVTLTNGSDIWYSTYMEYALENRIVRTDYSSVANEYVTRKEFVNIFYGALPLKEFARINNVEDNIIPDVKIGDAYSGEIYTFYRAGILTGNDAKGTFKPDSNISRSEVAAIVTRMLDSGARKYIDIN